MTLERWFKEHSLHVQALIILGKYGLSFEEVESKKGPGTGRGGRPKQHVALARHELIRFTKGQFPMWSTPALGQVFNLDHTSILSALKKDGSDDVYSQDRHQGSRERTMLMETEDYSDCIQTFEEVDASLRDVEMTLAQRYKLAPDNVRRDLLNLDRRGDLVEDETVALWHELYARYRAEQTLLERGKGADRSVVREGRREPIRKDRHRSRSEQAKRSR